MTSVILALCSCAVATLFYRAGYRNGYDSGITDAGELAFQVDVGSRRHGQRM